MPFLSGAYTVVRETDIGVTQCRYAVISGSDETPEEQSWQASSVMVECFNSAAGGNRAENLFLFWDTLQLALTR